MQDCSHWQRTKQQRTQEERGTEANGVFPFLLPSRGVPGVLYAGAPSDIGNYGCNFGARRALLKALILPLQSVPSFSLFSSTSALHSAPGGRQRTWVLSFVLQGASHKLSLLSLWVFG